VKNFLTGGRPGKVSGRAVFGAGIGVGADGFDSESLWVELVYPWQVTQVVQVVQGSSPLRSVLRPRGLGGWGLIQFIKLRAEREPLWGLEKNRSQRKRCDRQRADSSLIAAGLPKTEGKISTKPACSVSRGWYCGEGISRPRGSRFTGTVSKRSPILLCLKENAF